MLAVNNRLDVEYPQNITFSCSVKSMQVILDGSPLLYPDLDDCSLNVKLDTLCRVGHVCAACFIENNSVFRLLWLHCFKPHEHQFAGKVAAIYDTAKSALFRVRKPPIVIPQMCPDIKSCIKGRKCTKAHSNTELEFWIRNIQSGRQGPRSYSLAVSGPEASAIKLCNVIKRRHSINKEPSLSAIKKKLTPQSYCEKFHHLLYWEELEHIEKLDKRCVDPVNVTFCSDITVAQTLKPNNQYAMVGHVTMKDAHSAMYVTQASHTVRLHLPEGLRIEADIILIPFKSKINYLANLSLEDIPIALNERNVAIFKAHYLAKNSKVPTMLTNVKVQFLIKHSYFSDLHLAIDNFPQVMIQRVFPSISVSKRRFQTSNACEYNNILQPPFKPDKLQLEAISSMLSTSAEAPFLLLGPFGTGKTHVLACAAAAIVCEDAKAKVLIATHHNKSADTFVLKYFGTLESAKVLPPMVAPVRIASKDLSEDLEKPYFVKFNDPVITKDLLDERRIVVTTFLTALRFASTEKLPKGYFTHILIDEGAQTREPETIAPLVFADQRTKIIIAGDHLQVGPKTLVLGENAIKYGLADSLVERLFNMCYSNQNCPWRFNLLINYRSHEAIMRLSSNLFYKSTVVSKSDSKLHPSTCYPLHFVCTSLNHKMFQNVSDIQCDEVDTVLKEVKRYTEVWPRRWGRREKSSVCIVASSRSQVIRFKKNLSKFQINAHSYVEVLPSFDIQGREFRAVFVSTTEATDDNGCSKNPTKSMTDPFVFNTVVTRAQSLVVCVGNPYFLCHLEKKTTTGNKCWSTYISSCLDFETFVCINSDFGQMEKENLQSLLQINSGRYLMQELSPGVKIIESYLNSLAQFDLHKKALKFSKSWGDVQWMDYDDDDDDNEQDDTSSDSQLDSYVKCVIDFQSAYHALARPVQNTDRIIHINGRRNLRGCFHESTVLVEVEGSRGQPQQQDGRKVFNGKIVQLLSLDSRTFLCEVDHRNYHRFYPINKKDPALNNLPTLSKDESGVAVFDSQDIPRVVKVFPPQIAHKRIFVVQYLHWDPIKYRFPVGMVIDSFPKGHTFLAGEKLLCAQYKFDFFESEGKLNSVKQVNPVEPHKPDEIFTILRKSSEIAENAFSVSTEFTDTYRIGFYVANVAGYIEDNDLSDLLKKRGVSAFVKTDKLDNWKLHSMFPSELLPHINLDFHKPRRCFKVSCLAEVKNENVTYKPLENPITEVTGVVTKSYTLYEVENLVETQLEFVILFHIARCLQLTRLGYDAASYKCRFDLLETPCAQLLLREFSAWANRLVAIELANSSFESFPLQCKQPASLEERQSVYRDYGDALQTSVHNKYYLPKNGYKRLPEVKINSRILPLLLEALEEEKLFRYLAMLAYDNSFPQLHVASSKYRRIRRHKEFTSCSDNDELNFSCSHDSTFYTTMFTSPMTSYFDIVVQDMLSAALSLQSSKYGKEELNFICQKANKDFKRRSDFEENVFNLQLGVTLKAFNHRVVGYIENISNKNLLTLSFPSHELTNLSDHQSSFNIAHLFAFKSSANVVSSAKLQTSLYEWKLKVASFDGPPTIFTSPSILLSSRERLKYADATIDITLFMASGEETVNHYFVELDKKQMLGSLQSSTVSVSDNEWQKLTSVMSNPTDLCCTDAIKILTSHCPQPLSKKNLKQTAEQTVCWSGTVRRKLLQYDTLHAWFGAAQDTAIIYPKVKQIEIAPFLKVCIQHNSEPEKCFTDILLVNASKDVYIDIREYIELWGQVVIAENAVSSVRTRDILLLENVYLQWPELEYCCDSYTGDYYRVPKNEFVIMKPPLDFNKSNIELFDLNRGDLLCIQYEVPDKRLGIGMGFVFHMYVEKVENTALKDGESNELSSDEDFDIDQVIADNNNITDADKIEKTYYLSFSQSIEKVSEKFKTVLNGKPTCQVQILHISPPQRRIYRCLRNLHRSSDMSQNIACGYVEDITSDDQGFMFSVEEMSSVLLDEDVVCLWDKPNKKLSQNQREVLRLSCQNKFSIIHGPPGTGKSTVGAHLAYTFARLNQMTMRKNKAEKNRCVVYCGASNVSVDVVAKMLVDLGDQKSKQKKNQTQKLNVLRVYPTNIEQSVYPNPFELLHDSESSPVTDNLKLKELRLNSLHYKIRHECGQLGETIVKLERNFTENKQREKLASKADRTQYKDKIQKAQNKILSSDIDILVCTCNEMGSARIFHNIEAVQVVIDEAAMVTEPESMIPIQHAEQVVLIGDHQQLQPKAQSRHAERCGLSTSLFQRYLDQLYFKPFFLNEQFRMHARICEFPAKEFYQEVALFTNQDTAKEMEGKAKRLQKFWPNRDPSVPFVFCDVVGVEKVTDTEFIDKIRVGQESKYNPEEAMKIVDIAKVLVMNYGVRQQDILALSPYQAQCKHIHDKLKESKLNNVKSTTVKSSEGNECGVVLLSTVRSLPLDIIEDPEALSPDRGWMNENLGFLTDKHIINVGITRCKYGLIIVGNKCLLEYDATWCDLISYCRKHGNIVSEKQFPSRADMEKIKGFHL